MEATIRDSMGGIYPIMEKNKRTVMGDDPTFVPFLAPYRAIT